MLKIRQTFKLSSQLVVSILTFFIFQFSCLADYKSDIQKFSTVHLSTSQNSLAPNSSMWAVAHLELKPNWYTYWENPGDSGLAPTISVNGPKDITISKISFLPPTKIQVGSFVDYGYYNDAFLFFQIENHRDKPSNQPALLEFQIDWVTCHDMCIQQTGHIRLNLDLQDNQSSQEALFIEEKIKPLLELPQVLAKMTTEEDLVNLTMPAIDGISNPYVYIAPAKATDKLHLQTWEMNEENLTFKIKKGPFDHPTLHGFAQLNKDTMVKFTTPTNPDMISPLPLTAHLQPINVWIAIAFAFLGGIILNMMPCVFPVLALKIMTLAKIQHSAYRQRVWHGLLYSLGIIFAFFILATTISVLLSLGHNIGWGFQMQSPIFLGLMSYLLFLVALNLFGWLEFIIPISINTKNHDPASLKSSFYAGLLMTVIATPCTAPFMAPALGFALSQSTVVIFSIFISLGLGLAFPFLLLSFSPWLTRWIPRPGAWLITFKQFLAFPMLLSTIWLIWILIKSTDADFVAAILIGLTSMALFVWSLSVLHKRRKTKICLLIMLILVLLWPFSLLKTKAIEQTITFNLMEFENYLQKEQHVLVNVTADWCLTCKVNDAVFEQPEIKDFLEKNNIKRYTIDWTKKNTQVNQYLKIFERSGIPLYVYYRPDHPPKVLPQWLTPGMIKSITSEK